MSANTSAFIASPPDAVSFYGEHALLASSAAMGGAGRRRGASDGRAAGRHHAPSAVAIAGLDGGGASGVHGVAVNGSIGRGRHRRRGRDVVPVVIAAHRLAEVSRGDEALRL